MPERTVEEIARELWTSERIALRTISSDGYEYVPLPWSDLADARRHGLIDAYRGHRGNKARRTPLGLRVAAALARAEEER